MKNTLIDTDYNKLSYDPFTWSDNTKAKSPEYIVNVPLSKGELSKLQTWDSSSSKYHLLKLESVGFVGNIPQLISMQ